MHLIVYEIRGRASHRARFSGGAFLAVSFCSAHPVGAVLVGAPSRRNSAPTWWAEQKALDGYARAQPRLIGAANKREPAAGAH
jgi:hypothetical protein